MVQWSSHRVFLPFSPPQTTLLLSKLQPALSSLALSLFSSFALSAAALSEPKNWYSSWIYEAFFVSDLWFWSVILLFWSVILSLFLGVCMYVYLFPSSFLIYLSSFMINDSDLWIFLRFWFMIISSFLEILSQWVAVAVQEKEGRTKKKKLVLTSVVWGVKLDRCQNFK